VQATAARAAATRYKVKPIGQRSPRSSEWKFYDALKELNEYDPAKFEAANEEYLASIGAGKPEAQADRNGTCSPSGADLEKGL
jgi:hypothetical protein